MKYEFIGWCRIGSSDKVWGVIPLTTKDITQEIKYAVFWGRRGKTLQSKVFEGYTWDIQEKIQNKKDRGYLEVDLKKLNDLYPEFEEDLSKTAMWAILKA